MDFILIDPTVCLYISDRENPDSVFIMARRFFPPCLRTTKNALPHQTGHAVIRDQEKFGEVLPAGLADQRIEYPGRCITTQDAGQFGSQRGRLIHAAF